MPGRRRLRLQCGGRRSPIRLQQAGRQRSPPSATEAVEDAGGHRVIAVAADGGRCTGGGAAIRNCGCRRRRRRRRRCVTATARPVSGLIGGHRMVAVATLVGLLSCGGLRGEGRLLLLVSGGRKWSELLGVAVMLGQGGGNGRRPIGVARVTVGEPGRRRRPLMLVLAVPRRPKGSSAVGRRRVVVDWGRRRGVGVATAPQVCRKRRRRRRRRMLG